MANPSGPPTAFDALAVGGVPTMGMNGIPATTGNVFFVNSVTGSDGNTGSGTSPLATIATAYAKCVAGNGDVVVCTEGHAETLGAAAAINMNIAGVTVVGLGVGNARPTLTFATSTAATLTMTAANNVLSNFVIVCGIDQVVSPIVISAAGCTVNAEFHDGAANKEFVRDILTTAAADNLTLNITHIGFTSGTHGVNCIRLVGCDTGNISVDYYGKASTAVVEFLTTACTNITVGGYVYNAAATDGSKNVVDTATGSTWFALLQDGSAGATFQSGSGAAAGTSAISAVATGAAVMSNNLVAFNVAGGPVEIMALLSICQTANDTTASTLQWTSTGTLGTTSQTISGASATLASAAAGTSVIVQGTALSTAPVINTNGAGLGGTGLGLIVPAGALKLTIGVGSTTGTWKHYISYRPLAPGAAVTAAF